MKRRTLAIAGSLAALTFTAAPIAAATAATTHSTSRVERTERAGTSRDRSLDRSGKDRADRSVDSSRHSGHDRSTPDHSSDR